MKEAKKGVNSLKTRIIVVALVGTGILTTTLLSWHADWIAYGNLLYSPNEDYLAFQAKRANAYEVHKHERPGCLIVKLDNKDLTWITPVFLTLLPNQSGGKCLLAGEGLWLINSPSWDSPILILEPAEHYQAKGQLQLREIFWLNDNRSIIYRTYDYIPNVSTIYLFDTDEKVAKKLIGPQEDVQLLKISGDSLSLFYSSNYKLFKLDLRTGNIESIIPEFYKLDILTNEIRSIQRDQKEAIISKPIKDEKIKRIVNNPRVTSFALVENEEKLLYVKSGILRLYDLSKNKDMPILANYGYNLVWEGSNRLSFETHLDEHDAKKSGQWLATIVDNKVAIEFVKEIEYRDFQTQLSYESVKSPSGKKKAFIKWIKGSHHPIGEKSEIWISDIDDSNPRKIVKARANF